VTAPEGQLKTAQRFIAGWGKPATAERPVDPDICPTVGRVVRESDGNNDAYSKCSSEATREEEPVLFRPVRVPLLYCRFCAGFSHFLEVESLVTGRTHVGKVGMLETPSAARLQASLRDARAFEASVYPAMNRWAIIKRPSGTRTPVVRRIRCHYLWPGPLAVNRCSNRSE
jgi:hypothetical protein